MEYKIIIPIILFAFSLIPVAYADDITMRTTTGGGITFGADKESYCLGDEATISGSLFGNSDETVTFYVYNGIDGTVSFTIDIDSDGTFSLTILLPKSTSNDIEIYPSDIVQNYLPIRINYNPPDDCMILGPTGGDDPDIPEPIEKSSGGCADCIAPTLGYDRTGTKRVDDGICVNDTCVDAGKYHTPYPMQNTLIYSYNTISTKWYENNGPSNIKLIKLGIGVKEIGSPLTESDAIITVLLNPFKNDIYNPTISEIKVIDKNNILQNVNATISLVSCMYNSSNDGCLQVDFTYQYVKPPTSPILVTHAWDIPRNAFNNYINDGLDVIWYEPEIISPEPEPYICDDPIKQVMTRNNCHFRAMTLLWK